VKLGQRLRLIKTDRDEPAEAVYLNLMVGRGIEEAVQLASKDADFLGLSTIPAEAQSIFGCHGSHDLRTFGSRAAGVLLQPCLDGGYVVENHFPHFDIRGAVARQAPLIVKTCRRSGSFGKLFGPDVLRSIYVRV
jgi:hypothetical protein